MITKNIFFYILLLIILFITINKKESFVNYYKPQCITSEISTNTMVTNVGHLYGDNSLIAEYTTVNINNKLDINILHAFNFKGIIVAWHDTIDTIPIGWGLCDGSTYKDLSGNDIKTPDLRSVSILGATNSDNVAGVESQGLTVRFVGDASGVETHLLSEDEAPIHSHYSIITYNGNCNSPCPLANPVTFDYDPEGCPPGVTSETGGGKPHNNMPPYIALAYIMKIY